MKCIWEKGSVEGENFKKSGQLLLSYTNFFIIVAYKKGSLEPIKLPFHQMEVTNIYFLSDNEKYKNVNIKK